MIKKPMLAEMLTKECHDPDAVEAALHRLRYPVLGTPKIDGIRTFLREGKAVSRSLKRVPNAYTRALMESTLPDGVDGEFWMENTPFEEISGAWRRESGRPDFRYLVFDYLPSGASTHTFTYRMRMELLEQLPLPDWCQKLLPVFLADPQDVLDFEAACLEQGWEGVMLRSPSGPYKFGRSTLNEQWLIKLKRVVDAEAVIKDVRELYSNQNEPIKNALGHTERSGHRANLVPRGTLGALVVEGLTAFRGAVFRIGTGFDLAQRQQLWDDRESLIGQIVKFRYQDVGVKDAPRFPKFVGIRAPEDL